jgi:hypothetical protein
MDKECCLCLKKAHFLASTFNEVANFISKLSLCCLATTNFLFVSARIRKNHKQKFPSLSPIRKHISELDRTPPLL